MTEQYGRDQKLDISCDNEELAGLLGISDAYDPTGLGKCIHAEGSDVEAEFAKADDGSRAGFEDSAVISTKGTRITVKDVNNKEFSMDVPGNAAGTVQCLMIQ